MCEYHRLSAAQSFSIPRVVDFSRSYLNPSDLGPDTLLRLGQDHRVLGRIFVREELFHSLVVCLL